MSLIEEQRGEGRALVALDRSKSGAGARVDSEVINGTTGEIEWPTTPGSKIKKKSVRVTEPMLTAAALTQAINIGSPVPAGSRIVGVDIRGLTIFTGGGAAAVSVDIGSAGDVDALVDGANLFAAAVDGGPSTMPPGIRPNKTFAVETQLQALFIADVNVSLLTTGVVIIDVLYTELP